MHPRKKQYSEEIHQMVQQVCSKLAKSKKHAIPSVLGISNDDNKALIKKIIIGLPDRQFYQAPPEMLYDLETFITKNYVFFQAQEDIDDEKYASHLISFISSLVADIDQRYYE